LKVDITSTGLFLASNEVFDIGFGYEIIWTFGVLFGKIKFYGKIQEISVADYLWLSRTAKQFPLLSDISCFKLFASERTS
jgi:hypothetical protein